MRLSSFDLEQLDSDRLSGLSREEKDALLPKLIDDLKEARDRLNQNSQNSSRPPSSEPPWKTGKPSSFADEDAEDQDAIDEAEQSDGDGNDPSNDTELSPRDKDHENEACSKSGVPGRKPGMKGHGRKVELAVTSEEKHLPTKCCVCDCELNPDLFVAWTAFYVLDFVVKAAGLAGLEVTHVKHILWSNCLFVRSRESQRTRHSFLRCRMEDSIERVAFGGADVGKHDCMLTPLPAQQQERHSTILMNGSTFI